MDVMSIDFSDVQFTNAYWVLFLPCALMALDVLTGVTHAWMTGHLKSYRMREGLGRKAGELTILVMGALFTAAISLPPYIMGFFSLYIVVMELVSICENLKKLGIPIPRFVDRALGNIENKIQNGSDTEKEDDADG
jgi:toxin secretion/phage lysis holin